MILIGRMASPFVRRVAILMDLLGLDFEHRPISAVNEQEKLREFNPAGRVPALVTERGTLVDSTAIALTLLDRHDPEGRYWPKGGAELAQALQRLFLANAAAEKCVSAYYERTRRPKDKVHEPWAALCEDQSRGALDALERQVEGDFTIGDRATFSDVALVTSLTFVGSVSSGIFEASRHARLEALRSRCESLPAFMRCKPA